MATSERIPYLLLLLACSLHGFEGAAPNIRQANFVEREDCIDLSLVPVGIGGKTDAESLILCLDYCLSNSTCESASYLEAQEECCISDVILSGNCIGPTVSAFGSRIFEKNLYQPEIRTCQNSGVEQPDGSCLCQGGYVGNFCERLAYDCSEMGHYSYYLGMEGVYKIQPMSSANSFYIFCSFNYVYPRNYIQRHFGTGNTDFTLGWTSYKAGFGIHPLLTNDFWIGNEALHHVTSSGDYQLVVELAGEQWTDIYQRAFKHFRVSNEAAYYSMTFSSSNAQAGLQDAGDSLVHVNGSRFTTHDNDVDLNPTYNCGAVRQAGFWLTDAGLKCGDANPNGKIMRHGSGEWYDPFEAFWLDDRRFWAPWYVQMWLEKM